MHFYGKSVKPGRKIGHVTAYGDDLEDVRERGEVERHLAGPGAPGVLDHVDDEPLDHAVGGVRAAGGHVQGERLAVGGPCRHRAVYSDERR